MATFEQKVALFSARLQRDVGIKGFQADAVFGNAGLESGGMTQMQEINPTAGRGGLGWFQDTGPRRVAFEKWCTGKSLNPGDDEANYGFLVHELTTTENVALEALKLTRSRDDAVRVFMERFERPGVPALDKRISWAKRAELARLQTERKIMSDIMNTTAAVAPAAPAVPATTDGIADAVSRIEKKLEEFAEQQAIAHGVPSAIVSMVEMLIEKIDIPHLVAHAISQIDITKVVENLIAGLVSKKSA